MSPSGTDGIDERRFADDAGMSAVRLIQGDPSPIDESRSRPARRHPHRIVVEKLPRPAQTDPAFTLVQPHRNGFVSDISGCHLIGPVQHGAEIHSQVFRPFGAFLHLLGNLTGQTGASGQFGEILFRDSKILLGVSRLDQYLPQIVNDVVALLNRQKGKRRHLTVALSQGLKQAIGIRTVLEFGFPKLPGGRQRPLFFEIAVTGQANGVVDPLAANQGIPVPTSDDRGVIDVIVGRGRFGRKLFLDFRRLIRRETPRFRKQQHA